jgi:hypothetical protein
MACDEALAAEVRLISSAMRQAVDGLQSGKYESFECAMEALCGFRPVMVECDSDAPPDWGRVVIHHDARPVEKGARDDDG